jgi:hypothetical protein
MLGENMSRVKIGLLITLLVVVVGGLGGAGVYFYNQYQRARTLLKDPAAAAKEETRILVERVSRHMLLNTQETPIVAKVTDANQLAQNPFFANAQTGDVMLVFQEANRAVLFRPEADRIVNIVSPLNTRPEVAGTASAVMQMTSAKLAIYNSTNTSGLASVAERKIKAQTDQIRVLAKLNSNNNYKETRVVVLNPEAQTLGTRLMEMFKAEITFSLPAGEAKPDADLLLILGTDYKP